MQNFTRVSWATGTSHGRIKHRFKLFQALYQELLISKALLKLPFPTHMEEVLICSSFATHICSTRSTKSRWDFEQAKRAKLTLMHQTCFCTHFPDSVLISQLRILCFSAAHTHFLQFSSSEKYSMFSQKVEIHLYNKATEGFQNTASSQMKPSTMWLSYMWGAGNWWEWIKFCSSKNDVVTLMYH